MEVKKFNGRRESAYARKNKVLADGEEMGNFYFNTKELSKDLMDDPEIKKFSSKLTSEIIYSMDEDENWIEGLKRMEE